MGEFEATIREHSVLEKLQDLEPRLQALRTDEPEKLEPVERLRTATRFIVSQLEAADPFLVSRRLLDALETQLASVIEAVAQYVQLEDASHLTEANVRMDEALNLATAGLPIKAHSRSIKAAQTSLASFSKSSEESLRALSDQIVASHNQLAELRQLLEKEKSEIATQLEPTRANLDSVTAQVEAQKTRLDSALNEFQQNTTTTLREQDQTFKEFVESNESAIKELIAKETQASESLRSEFISESNDLMRDLHRLKAEAESVVGAIGSTGVSGGFQKYANEQRKEANRWRLVAAVSLSALVLSGLASLFFWDEGTFGSGETLGKLLVTASLGALGAYAGNQSAFHRKRERAARQFELEVAAFDPYIVLLPEEMRHELKGDMARRVFGRLDESGDKELGVITLSNEIATRVVSLLDPKSKE